MRDEHVQIYERIEDVKKQHSVLIKRTQKSQKRTNQKNRFIVVSILLVSVTIFISLIYNFLNITIFSGKFIILDILFFIIQFILLFQIIKIFQYRIEPDVEIEMEHLRKLIRLLERDVKTIHDDLTKIKLSMKDKDEEIESLKEFANPEILSLLQFLCTFVKNMEKENKNENEKEDENKDSMGKILYHIKKQLDEIHKELGNYSQKDYPDIKKISDKYSEELT